MGRAERPARHHLQSLRAAHAACVSDRCACCQRLWSEVRQLGRIPAQTDTRNDGTRCADCGPHAGFALQSDRDHLRLWRELLADHDDQHAREATGLRERIDALEQQLRDRPERVVDRYVDLGELQLARAEADRAFRSREHAWQALTEIRLLHREDDAGQCRCGTRADKCPVALIVDRYPALRAWEDEQVDRLRRGESHALPDGHPAVLDRRGAPAIAEG